MIKASMATDQGSLLILGLSRENCRRLLDDQPIVVNVQEIDPRLPDLRVLLVGGETEDAITADLRKHVLGIPNEEQL